MPKRRSPLLSAFGSRIRQRRLRLGISQEELAERSGLHRTYVGSVERGERNVSLINATRIAKALGVDLGRLLSRLDNME